MTCYIILVTFFSAWLFSVWFYAILDVDGFCFSIWQVYIDQNRVKIFFMIVKIVISMILLLCQGD